MHNHPDQVDRHRLQEFIEKFIRKNKIEYRENIEGFCNAEKIIQKFIEKYDIKVVEDFSESERLAIVNDAIKQLKEQKENKHSKTKCAKNSQNLGHAPKISQVVQDKNQQQTQKSPCAKVTQNEDKADEIIHYFFDKSDDLEDFSDTKNINVSVSNQVKPHNSQDTQNECEQSTACGSRTITPIYQLSNLSQKQREVSQGSEKLTPERQDNLELKNAVDIQNQNSQKDVLPQKLEEKSDNTLTGKRKHPSDDESYQDSKDYRNNTNRYGRTSKDRSVHFNINQNDNQRSEDSYQNKRNSKSNYKQQQYNQSKYRDNFETPQCLNTSQLQSDYKRKNFQEYQQSNSQNSMNQKYGYQNSSSYNSNRSYQNYENQESKRYSSSSKNLGSSSRIYSKETNSPDQKRASYGSTKIKKQEDNQDDDWDPMPQSKSLALSTNVQDVDKWDCHQEEGKQNKKDNYNYLNDTIKQQDYQEQDHNQESQINMGQNQNIREQDLSQHFQNKIDNSYQLTKQALNQLQQTANIENSQTHQLNVFQENEQNEQNANKNKNQLQTIMEEDIEESIMQNSVKPSPYYSQIQSCMSPQYSQASYDYSPQSPSSQIPPESITMQVFQQNFNIVAEMMNQYVQIYQNEQQCQMKKIASMKSEIGQNREIFKKS
eukprot:403344781